MKLAICIMYACSVCYIAGEFALFLKNQFEEESKYSKSELESTKEQKSQDGIKGQAGHYIGENPRSVSNEEVLCLHIAGLCHDLGIE